MLHDLWSGLFDDAGGQVGHDDLCAPVELEIAGKAHGLYQVLSQQHDHQHIGIAGLGLLQRRQVVVMACAMGWNACVAVPCPVPAFGCFAQCLFHAVTPGIIEADVVIAPVGQVPAEVFAQHPRAHPGAVGLPEQMAMTFAASDFIGITQRGEIQQPQLPRALAGGDGLFAGGATEYHAHALGGESIDIGQRLFFPCRRVSADEFQRLAQYTAPAVDFLDSKQRATPQLKTF